MTSTNTYVSSYPMEITTLHEALLHTLSLYGSNPFIGTKQEGTFTWMTYAEFGVEVEKARTAMLNLGIGHGDSVACISNNRKEWAVAAYATYSIGATFVPMYEVMSLGDKEFILSDSAAKLVLASNQKLLNEVMTGEAVNRIKAGWCFDGEGDNSWSTVLNKSNTILPAQPPTASDIAVIIYTSGTTGRPKGVMLSHANLVHQIHCMTERCSGAPGGFTASDVYLSILPWSHSFGISVELNHGLSKGASIGIAGSVKTLVEDMKLVRPTLLVAVPQLFNKMYDGLIKNRAEMYAVTGAVYDWAMSVAAQRRNSLDTLEEMSTFLSVEWSLAQTLVLDKIKEKFGGKLRYCFTGGAPLNRVIQECFNDIGIPILEGYGLTESSPMMLGKRYGLTEFLQGGLQPVYGVEVYILDPSTREEVPDGKEGEIACSGANVMVGYLNNKEKTDETIFINKEGKRVLLTGDLGKKTLNGSVSITGRVKELYKLSNGKYVMPGDIEGKATLSPYINHAMLYGDGKEYNVLVIVPNFNEISDRLDIDLATTTPADIANNPDVINMVMRDVQEMVKDEEHKYMIPRNILLVSEDFTIDNGLMTPKLSMKRNKIVEKYLADINNLYASGKPAVTSINTDNIVLKEM